uniref:Uncharacterized protein n=1 Tax=Rhizophora mucronata TaxID=61149 RepID=A0A2P2PI50_RHIMU
MIFTFVVGRVPLFSSCSNMTSETRRGDKDRLPLRIELDELKILSLPRRWGGGACRL